MSQPEVGFKVQPLPAVLRLPTALADRFGIEAPYLTPEKLCRAGARAAGLAEDYPAHVTDALEVLCRSLHDDARLHWFGRMNQSSLLVTGLATVLKVEQCFREDPTLIDEPLVAPMIVTGLPRSGTTFLHRLLSASPDASSVAMYQHIHPLPHRPMDLRRLDVAMRFHPWRLASSTYGLDAIHFVRPALPDECNFGMRIGMRSMIYWATAPTYGYLEWLLQQDLREAYLLYRKVLILHQRQNPGRRLTLKCPHHLAWLPALTEALPEAHIVQTHRDPVQAVPSECKLILSLQSLSTREIDWRRTVQRNHLKVKTFADRAVDFARTTVGQRIHHIDYRQLVADPVGVSREIHARVGLNFSEAHEADIKGFVAENTQHKHGRNQYSPEQFELSRDGLMREFAPYRERFLDLAGPPSGSAQA
jgi:hypothetical protein